MIHKSEIINAPAILEYWRNPTAEDIKFGHGALHYREFKFDDCFDKNGYLKLKVKSTDDQLTYYYYGIEYSTTRKAKLDII